MDPRGHFFVDPGNDGNLVSRGEARRCGISLAASSDVIAGFNFFVVLLKLGEGTPIAQRQLDAHRTGMATVRAQGTAASLGAGM